MNGIGDQPSLQTRAYLDKTLQLTKLYNPEQQGEKKKLLFLPMAQFSCWFIDGMSEISFTVKFGTAISRAISL